MSDHQTTHQAQEDARNETIKIWLNGQIVPKDEAKVSVYDSGFMLGDGVWEGLRLYNGTWAFADEHLDRLFEAAKAIDLEVGDRFYAFTDGIVEASNPDGEEFGMDRLIQCFERLAGETVQVTQQSIYDTVAKHTRSENQQDDITLLAFELT